MTAIEDDDEEEAMQDIGEECTSGEEVWGTPTSGENDEMQMFNSDQTHSVNLTFFCSPLFCVFFSFRNFEFHFHFLHH